MFNFIKFALGIVALAALAYFVFFVRLGDKTLHRHVVGISHTSEAKNLGAELEKKIESTAGDISRDLKKRAPALLGDQKQPDKAQPPTKNHQALGDPPLARKEPNDQDRKALERLISEKNK